MTSITLDGYYNRFDASKNYESVLFRAGRVLQSAELNDWQSGTLSRMQTLTDCLFHDGSVIRDADLIINQSTGSCQCNAGAVYLRGAVRGVSPRTFTISLVTTVIVGIWLYDVVVTELTDATLRNPAVETQNYDEPGAARQQVTTTWGLPTDSLPGTFYPVWTVVNGVVVSKDVPPGVDAVALAIARYDRESAGGFYIANGLNLSILPDSGSSQVYSLSEGVARVNGNEISLPHAVRLTYPTAPDLHTVAGEPHVAAGGTERVNTNHNPINSIQSVLVITQVTRTITHGLYSGVQDLLPDTPVFSIMSVVQGGTTYHSPADFLLTSDHVDWSPTGAEPSPGTTYTVVYQYAATVSPGSPDTTGFSVTGAVAGSVIQVNYQWDRPRYDRLVLDTNGTFSWVKGMPDDAAPFPPVIPAGTLEIATVYQTWNTSRAVIDDSVRTVAMPDLNAMQTQISNLFNMVSYLRLQTAAALSDPATKLGFFAENFLDNTMRDQGFAQTAAIVNGVGTLPISGVVVSYADLGSIRTLPLGTAVPVISQTLRTATMLINPYQAFTPLPASVTLSPATDFWTDYQTTWATPVTNLFEQTNISTTLLYRPGAPDHGTVYITGVQTSDIVVDSVNQVGQTTTYQSNLRQISVGFSATGFGPGENLQTVIFDGVSVAFTA